MRRSRWFLQDIHNLQLSQNRGCLPQDYSQLLSYFPHWEFVSFRWTSDPTLLVHALTPPPPISRDYSAQIASNRTDVVLPPISTRIIHNPYRWQSDKLTPLNLKRAPHSTDVGKFQFDCEGNDRCIQRFKAGIELFPRGCRHGCPRIHPNSLSDTDCWSASKYQWD